MITARALELTVDKLLRLGLDLIHRTVKLFIWKMIISSVFCRTLLCSKSHCVIAMKTAYHTYLITALDKSKYDIIKKCSERRKHCVLPMQAGSVSHLCTEFEADRSIRSISK